VTDPLGVPAAGGLGRAGTGQEHGLGRTHTLPGS
jgi:hypothetical protein